MTSTVKAECTPTPDCASIGYTATSCTGGNLKCPFDTSKLFCIPCDNDFKYTCNCDNIINGIGSPCDGKYASCACSSTDYIFSNGNCICNTSCSVGAIYYSDGSCSACADTNKTPVGVVVKDDELIVSLLVGEMPWSTDQTDISSLENIYSSSSAKMDYAGKNNTANILAHYTNSTNTVKAALYCYNNAPIGLENSKNKWYLPSFGEAFSYIAGNYSKLQTTIVNKLGRSAFSYYFWTSSEISYGYAWAINTTGDSSYHADKTINHSVLCLMEI